eukprot:403343553
MHGLDYNSLGSTPIHLLKSGVGLGGPTPSSFMSANSNLNGYTSPASALNRSLKQNLGDVHFNNKEIKNISFLPFLRERNGLGKIIESDQEIPLKHRKVPSIMETNRILAQKKKQSEESAIKLSNNQPSSVKNALSGLAQDNFSFQIIPTITAELSFEEQQKMQQQIRGIQNKQSFTLSPNHDLLNNSKFLDNQEDLNELNYQLKKKNSLPFSMQNQNILTQDFSKIFDTPMESIRDKIGNQSSIISNKNHVIPYVNFKIQKDKNFLFLNQISHNNGKVKQIKKNQNGQQGVKKIKLRDSTNIISHNTPCLGTYDPKPEVIEPRQSAGFSFENSSLSVTNKNQNTNNTSLFSNKQHLQGQNYSLMKRSQSQSDYIGVIDTTVNTTINNGQNVQTRPSLIQKSSLLLPQLQKQQYFHDSSKDSYQYLLQLLKPQNEIMSLKSSHNRNQSESNILNLQGNSQSQESGNNNGDGQQHQQNTIENQRAENKKIQQLQQNQSNQGAFDTRLPEIPLDSVYDNRSKIKSMIMDIKTNIYKIDKY